jgi:hypothetical protein
MADQPARYDSHPESSAIAPETMRQIKAALTNDAMGHFLASHAAEVRPPANSDAFDRVVADLPHRWFEDGHGDTGETWEQQSAVEKIGYLAGRAAAHNLSFERFVAAAGRTLGLASGEEFTPVEVQHLLRQIRWAHGDDSDDRTGRSPHSAPKDRLAFIAAIADEHDGMPTLEEWRKLHAEWTHDYGLRRLEERGVRYQDEAERSLDLTAEGMPSPADLVERAGDLAHGNGRTYPQTQAVTTLTITMVSSTDPALSHAASSRKDGSHARWPALRPRHPCLLPPPRRDANAASPIDPEAR